MRGACPRNSASRVNSPVLCDITSLIAFPYRSGIQRVTRQTLRHWPDPDELVPCAFDAAGRLRLLSRAVLPILCPAEEAVGPEIDDEHRALPAFDALSSDLPDDAPRRLLNVEPFYEQSRADAYIRLVDPGWQTRFLVYDFFPWLHPELYPMGTTRNCMHYLRALRCVDAAFISEQTRHEYAERIMRGSGRPGPVLPLGADALGLERQSWSPERRAIVAIGTLEARKEPAPTDGRTSTTMAARPRRTAHHRRTHPRQVPTRLAELAVVGRGRLTVLEQPSDDVLRDARAVVYASEIEGFGLPPYEGLYIGIPSIAAATLPSMQLLPPRGHIALQRIDAETLADAMVAVLDDTFAQRLWEEAAGIELPTWRDFGRAVAAWAAA